MSHKKTKASTHALRIESAPERFHLIVVRLLHRVVEVDALRRPPRGLVDLVPCPVAFVGAQGSGGGHPTEPGAAEARVVLFPRRSMLASTSFFFFTYGGLREIQRTSVGGAVIPRPTKKPTWEPARTVAVLVPGRGVEALRPQMRSLEVGSVLG